MKPKLTTLLSLLLFVHFIPVLQSCDWLGWMDCGVEDIHASADRVSFIGSDNEYEEADLLDRNTFYLSIVIYSSEISFYQESLFGMSSAMATTCPDPKIILDEHIQAIEIVTDTGEDLTDRFMVDVRSDELYMPLDSYLSNDKITSLHLVHQGQVTVDQWNLTLRVTLSDGRVMSASKTFDFL